MLSTVTSQEGGPLTRRLDARATRTDVWETGNRDSRPAPVAQGETRGLADPSTPRHTGTALPGCCVRLVSGRTGRGPRGSSRSVSVATISLQPAYKPRSGMCTIPHQTDEDKSDLPPPHRLTISSDYVQTQKRVQTLTRQGRDCLRAAASRSLHQGQRQDGAGRTGSQVSEAVPGAAVGLLDAAGVCLVVFKSSVWVFFLKQTIFFPDFIMP